MADYATLPPGCTLKIENFNLHVSERDLEDFKTLLRLSKLAPKTYENIHTDDGRYGVSHEWMTAAKEYWLNEYDWRATEAYNNSFPNFIAEVPDIDNEIFDIHFAALFSKASDAIPILFMHGWPGSHLEHLGLLDIYRSKYRPEDLPYHVIAVSLPGWTLSSGPPLNKDFTVADIARVMNSLMVGLGFGAGYVCQGGDVGSITARTMAAFHEECKDNSLFFTKAPEGLNDSQISPEERQGWEIRGPHFSRTGRAYSDLHGTRPATIGFVLSSSPLAQLAWIGEKFVEWTDRTPSLKNILDSITLYWFTESFPRCIYPYREFLAPDWIPFHQDPKLFNQKPMAYSWFPKEIMPVPRAFVDAQRLNLVHYKQHSSGGHFAAFEKPEEIIQDVDEFMKKTGWPLK